MSATFSAFSDPAFSMRRAVPTRPSWMATSAPEKIPAGAASGGQLLHVAPDAELYADGAESVSFYKVVSGLVRTCKFRSDGRRQIDAFYLPGDSFGFEDGGRHRLSAEAVCETYVVAYRWRGAEALSAGDAALAPQLLSLALQGMRRAQDHALLLGRRSASQKVAAFLTDMIDRSVNDEVIELAMSRQDIADYLGLTIETVSRTLSQLERDEMIALPSARRVRVQDRLGLRHLSS
ncbi:transcriptional regulator, Crp/Fnr family [Methylocella silvestris BL2]|uniref:Transcriptional regulator, Crp/Fnr family n=1 Tax=Methylocella silvestris (strain DSM 15510 / CIP 108128 / LMG 27833 / NCIMB 13906 / BL2) TaxID=395965 RepID=B8ELY7_METSB|nr:helix-turn-helix domain-containing protein [Methylocella silvestris]ACK50768.1 transcriptional regulator, Crp/Fnr family [Methylocella silvestris BL2]